jgi:hypothetical protein
MSLPASNPVRLVSRVLQLCLGFAATAFAANHWAGENGLLMMEREVNPTRIDLVRAWFERESVEDVLVIGSSRVAGGFDALLMTEALEDRVEGDCELYKLGVAGMRPALMADILEEGVRRRPPRRLLVLAIEERYFAYPVPSASARSGTRNDAELIRGEWETDRVPDPLLDWSRGLAIVWRGDRELSEESRANRARYQENFGERITLAERIQRQARTAEALRTAADYLELPPGLEWEWPAEDSNTMAAWRRCLAVVDDLPCETIFIRMPVQRSFLDEEMPREDALFESQIVASVLAAGHRYVDLGASPYPFQKRYFNSMTHLNRDGCVAMSEVFVREVLVPLLRADEPDALLAGERARR